MKLEKVEIENFRQYNGKQPTVSFSKDPQRNVTIIQGVNGAGKSNFFKAINWCIYEKLDDHGEITSKAAISKAKKGEIITTEVRVSFSHQAKQYLLGRSIECVKKDEKIHIYQNSTFTMMKITSEGKAVKIDNPVGEINSILPENVRTYFLFDGEKIDNFSKPESGADVKNAIYNVLKLEVLTRSRKHLEDIASEFRQDLKSIGSKELNELINRYETAKTDKDKIVLRQGELDTEITLAKEKIGEINKKLEGMKEASQLQKERSRLEQDVEQKRKDLTDCIRKIQKTTTNAIGIVGSELLGKALTIIDSKRLKGEIPSSIRGQFLDDIIDRKLCICGRHFVPDSLEHQNLIKLKNTSVSSVVEDEVLNLNSGVKSMLNEAEFQRKEIDETMYRRSSLIDQIKQLEAQIDDLHVKLKNSRLEDIQKLEGQRDDFKNDIERYTLDKGKNEEKIKNLDRDSQQISLEINQAKKDGKKHELLSQKMNLTQAGADAINGIYQQFADEMRGQIEQMTKEVFQQIVWKESQFQEIKLGPDYRLDVVDRWGYPASPELSAGERQVLSLAFITAMAKASGEEAPIVMDTPFGRLSTAHREKITLTIPSLADQMILFVTDEELRGQMEKNLNSRIGERYQLNFNDKTGCTTIDRE